jgi:quinol monooxygenase YgiN
MRKLTAALLGLMALITPGLGIAQSAAPAYTVTYVEVAPSSAEAAGRLLGAYGAAGKAAEGNIASVPLRQIGREGHLALVQVWRDGAAQAAHAASEPARTFRSSLQPLLVAPYDERPHSAMAAAAPDQASYVGALFVLTHVDVIPTAKEEGLGAVRDLVAASRGRPGGVRYDALTQTSRPNHMTLVEVWRSAQDFEGYVTAEATKSFRERFLPLSGSLYDERLYRALD